jgi:hypothetical protein
LKDRIEELFVVTSIVWIPPDLKIELEERKIKVMLAVPGSSPGD